MSKEERSPEQQVADEAVRRALHPLATRQTIADSQAEPAFHVAAQERPGDRDRCLSALRYGHSDKNDVARYVTRDISQKRRFPSVAGSPCAFFA